MLHVFHNPRCKKSREAILFLKENNLKFTEILYIKNGLSKDIIQSILEKLRIEPKDLLRKQEKIWKESYKNKNLNKKKLIDIILEHPNLMERPIIISHDSGIIGRPIERLKSFIKSSKF